MNYLAKNIIYLKKEKSITNASIALQVNKSHNTISNWINEVAQPGIEELQILSHFLGANVDELINVDLSNVHYGKKEQTEKNKVNVQDDVRYGVQFAPKKQEKKGVAEEMPSGVKEGLVSYKPEPTVVQVQADMIELLKAQNAQQAQLLTQLQEEIRNLKREIPVINQPMEGRASKTA